MQNATELRVVALLIAESRIHTTNREEITLVVPSAASKDTASSRLERGSVRQHNSITPLYTAGYEVVFPKLYTTAAYRHVEGVF